MEAIVFVGGLCAIVIASIGLVFADWHYPSGTFQGGAAWDSQYDEKES